MQDAKAGVVVLVVPMVYSFILTAHASICAPIRSSLPRSTNTRFDFQSSGRAPASFARYFKGRTGSPARRSWCLPATLAAVGPPVA